MLVQVGRRITKFSILMTIFSLISLGLAYSCNTSSGSECQFSCSVGSLSLTCSSESSICSGSCSDPKDAKEIIANLVYHILESSNDNLDYYDIIHFLNYDFSGSGNYDINGIQITIITDLEVPIDELDDYYDLDYYFDLEDIVRDAFDYYYYRNSW